MTTADPAPLDPTTTYLCLDEDGGAAPLPVGPDFWERIHERADLRAGRLVSAFDMDADWPHWEMHPAGDEVVVVLTGAFELILDEPAGPRAIPLTAGQTCLIPQNVWHRARVAAPCRALFITAGAGTRHRPL